MIRRIAEVKNASALAKLVIHLTKPHLDFVAVGYQLAGAAGAGGRRWPAMRRGRPWSSSSGGLSLSAGGGGVAGPEPGWGGVGWGEKEGWSARLGFGVKQFVHGQANIFRNLPQ